MFWDKFVKLCSEHGTKPNPVAAKLGLSSGSVTNWKNGATPSSVTIQKIADYFDVSVDYLLGNDAGTSRSETLPDILYRFPELSDDRKKEVLAFVEFKLAQQLDDQKG